MDEALLKQIRETVGTDLMHSGTSEEDRPMDVFQRSAAEVAGKQDIKGLIASMHPGEPLAEQSLDDFFSPVTVAEDWQGEAPEAAAIRKGTAKRFQELQQLFGTLNDPKVFVVGGGADKAVYVVGAGKCGDALGVKTSVVES